MPNDRSIPQQFADLKADYKAVRPSRYRRTRKGLSPSGSSADYHYRNTANFLKLMETARDVDRNDAPIGQMIDRSVCNIIQDGIKLDVRTGDEVVDRDLVEDWRQWSIDPDACDIAGELTFLGMERLGLRQQHVDGDCLIIGTREGSLQMIEAHRVRSPKDRSGDSIIHGVELSPTRRRLRYYVTKDDINPLRPAPLFDGNYMTYSPRNTEGLRQVFHIYNPRRSSQTRGVTALAPIMDEIGMLDDLHFANLLRAQVSTCFAIIREKAVDYDSVATRGQTGPQTTDSQSDGSVRTIENIAPGMEIEGRPGETIKGFAPNVPNPEFFPHFRMVLQLIGLALGEPLIMVLLDASETNFSGWRGAMDQARMGFKDNQRQLIARFHRPCYLWWIEQQLRKPENRALRAAARRSTVNIRGHMWSAPTWPYIEPFKDAKSDQVRMEHGLTSPRRLQSERGRDWGDVAEEIVADRALIIGRALARAAEMRKTHPELAGDFDYRDLLPAGMAKIRQPSVVSRQPGATGGKPGGNGVAGGRLAAVGDLP